MTMKRDGKNMKRKDEVDIDFTNCKKVMSSNLPLLFANGQPRSLETISQPELEEFVPFMVRCSLGQDILKKPKEINNCPAPEWWPQGFPFKFPLIEQSDWINRLVMLKSLVCRCYTFYNCEFLLKFSSELADMPPSHLNFDKNQNDTTSIYDPNGCLLVKCRNENLNYDLHKNPRRYLSPAHRSSLNQAKKFEPVIDLTFDTSSEDEKEVYFKETVAPASRKAGKQKTSVEQSEEPVLAKRRCLRLFNDFPQERPEPTTYNQEQFMEKFQLIPLGKEIPRDVLRVERRKRLAKSFNILSISSRRGQEFLTKSRHSFNVESYLSRIERFCSPWGEEEGESSQVYTRAAATFSAMYKMDEEKHPENNPITELEETEDKWYHSYKWAHRTNNPVYPYRGPSVKPCTVMLSKLSKDELELYQSKKIMCTVSTMTPEEWWNDDLAICNCQLISYNLSKPLYSNEMKYKNKKCSTVCTCGSSKAQFLLEQKCTLFDVKLEMNNKEMCDPSKQEDSSVKSRSRTSNGGFNDYTSSETDYTYKHVTELPLSQKRALFRRPLAVVPPMPSTISRPVVSDLMSPPTPQVLPPLSQHTASTSCIKANFTRSILDAIKWYTKDEDTSFVEDELCDFSAKEEVKTIDPSQENIKPSTELTLPNFTKPLDYFQQNLNVAEYDYCFKRTSDGSSKLVTRRGERHYLNREPCPSCFQGRNNFCVYEFVRQAKVAGLSLQENQKHLQTWFFKFIISVNRK